MSYPLTVLAATEILDEVMTYQQDVTKCAVCFSDLGDDTYLICDFPVSDEAVRGSKKEVHEGHTACKACVETRDYVGEKGACVACLADATRKGARRSAVKLSGVAKIPAVKNTLADSMIKGFRLAEKHMEEARDRQDYERRQEGVDRRAAAVEEKRKKRDLEEKEVAARLKIAEQEAKEQIARLKQQAEQEAKEQIARLKQQAEQEAKEQAACIKQQAEQEAKEQGASLRQQAEQEAKEQTARLKAEKKKAEHEALRLKAQEQEQAEHEALRLKAQEQEQAARLKVQEEEQAARLKTQEEEQATRLKAQEEKAQELQEQLREQLTAPQTAPSADSPKKRKINVLPDSVRDERRVKAKCKRDEIKAKVEAYDGMKNAYDLLQKKLSCTYLCAIDFIESVDETLVEAFQEKLDKEIELVENDEAVDEEEGEEEEAVMVN